MLCKLKQRIAGFPKHPLDIDELYHFIDSPIHILAIGLNLGLLYINRKRATSNVKTYQGPLLMSCLSDLVLAIIVAISGTVSRPGHCRRDLQKLLIGVPV